MLYLCTHCAKDLKFQLKMGYGPGYSVAKCCDLTFCQSAGKIWTVYMGKAFNVETISKDEKSCKNDEAG